MYQILIMQVNTLILIQSLRVQLVNIRRDDSSQSDHPLRYDLLRSYKIIQGGSTIGSLTDTIIANWVHDTPIRTFVYFKMRSSRTYAMLFNMIRGSFNLKIESITI